MWIQIYTYKSANWSMILQSSFLFFYKTSIFKWFEFHQIILWFHLLSSWLYNLINLVFIDRFSQFSWRSRYSRNLRINHSRIVNDSLNLIQRTRQVALWHWNSEKLSKFLQINRRLSDDSLVERASKVISSEKFQKCRI
jgi:signal transduction histidine kinase